MASGLPALNRSSGRQSASSIRWPWRAAIAAASCSRSRIGIGGSCSRAGSPPSQCLLVAAGGEQHLAPGALGQVAQEVRQLVLLGGGPGAGGAGREPGDRLGVVPHPQHRHLRQQLQHQVPALGRVGDRLPVDPAGLQRTGEDSPRRCRAAGPAGGSARRRTTAPVRVPTLGGPGDQARRSPGTSGRTPPRWWTSRPRRRHAAALPCWVSNARSSASKVSSRPKNPASGGRGNPSSAPACAAVGGGDLDQWRSAGARRQEG